MKLRWLGLLAPVFFLPWVYAGGPALKATPQAAVSSFNQIDVEGYLDLIIKRAPKNHVFVASHSAHISTYIKGHTLMIRAPWIHSPIEAHRPVVMVSLPRLSQLLVNGPANVSSQGLRAKDLRIEASGTSHIRLSGMINLAQVDQSGQSHVSVYWVDGNTITIHSRDHANTFIAGTAKMLYARLCNHASLNAQYLRSNDVQAQTIDDAVASVMPISTLRAFASNTANIYYYAYPKHLTRATSDSGNVLQMAWRP